MTGMRARLGRPGRGFAVALCLFGAADVSGASAQPPGTFSPGGTLTVQEYVVPYLCGRNVTRIFPLTEGDFATAVFVHNPGGRIQISHKSVSTVKGAAATSFKAVMLERNQALMLTCFDFPPQRDLALSTGVLVIRSATDLDVMAFQSNAPLGTQGVDSDVRSERIPARSVTIPLSASNNPG